MFEVWTGKTGQPRIEREMLRMFSDIKDAIAFAEEYGMDECSIELGLPEMNKYFIEKA